jgi:hypothetical protein
MRRLETFLNETPAPHSGVDCRVVWNEYWKPLLQLNQKTLAEIEAERKAKRAA